MQRFYDHGQGGVWFSQELHRTPITRIKDVHDRSEPAPNAVFILCAIKLYQQFNDSMYLEKAVHTIESFVPTIIKAQDGCDTFWMGMKSFWQCFNQQGGRIGVQFAVAKHLGDDFWDIVLDISVQDYVIFNGDVELQAVEFFGGLTLKLIIENTSFLHFQIQSRVRRALSIGWSCAHAHRDNH